LSQWNARSLFWYTIPLVAKDVSIDQYAIAFYRAGSYIPTNCPYRSVLRWAYPIAS